MDYLSDGLGDENAMLDVDYLATFPLGEEGDLVAELAIRMTFTDDVDLREWGVDLHVLSSGLPR